MHGEVNDYQGVATHKADALSQDRKMLTQTTRAPLILLLLGAIPVDGSLAQGSRRAAPEKNVSRRIAVVESNTALPPHSSAIGVARTLDAATIAAINDGAIAKSEPPAPPTLPAGTAITIFIKDTITSRHDKVGEPVIGMIAHPVRDASGEAVIPADAVLLGVISDITSEDDGRMELTFYSVAFGGNTYPTQVRVISLPTRKQRRGNTAGDAAKVGAGAVVGGIAGRLLGGNKKGTFIGAASGAAAGVGVTAATRKEDIVLDAGAPVILVLTAPFAL